MKAAMAHRMIPIAQVDKTDGKTGVVNAARVATASMSSQLGIPHNEKIVTPTITPIAERGGGADRGGFPFGLLLLVVAMLFVTIGKFEVLRAKKIKNHK